MGASYHDLDQNLVSDACEQPGNTCQCTNQHCGIPTFGNGNIPLSIYDIDDGGYLFPWIQAVYGFLFVEKYYARNLIKQFQTTGSLPPDVMARYNAWYAKLRQNPVAIYELCVSSYVPAWIAMSGKLPSEKLHCCRSILFLIVYRMNLEQSTMIGIPSWNGNLG